MSLDNVKEFHETFNHPVATSPTLGNSELRELRAKLILEEAIETINALGCEVLHSFGRLHVHTTQFEKDLNLADVAKELADLDYVTKGTYLALGIPANAVEDEVHRSNMSKVGEDGKPIYRDDGKVLKGPNYSPADIKAVLRESGYAGN